MTFPFDLHSAAVFDSHIPCCSHAVPLPCHEYAFHGRFVAGSRQGDGMVYHTDFHEGHSTVGEWQGSGRVAAGERHGMCKSALNGATAQLSHGG